MWHTDPYTDEGRESEISAEQWSPMVAEGDVHVTEMLTPLVNIATDLLMFQILQVPSNSRPKIPALKVTNY